MATISNFKLVPPDAQQSVWLTGDQATFIATDKDTNGQLSLFDFIVPPGIGTTPHIHHHESSESYYILDGNVSLQYNDQTVTATPGNFVYTPGGNTVGFRNLGTTPARMLVVTTPSGLEDFFSAVGTPVTGTTPPPPPPLDPALFNQLLAISSVHGLDLPDSLNFTDDEYSVNQNGTAQVSVLRPGDATGAVSATINLSDGSSETKVPVNFADQQRTQTVNIPISDQGLATGNKTAKLSLSDPTGGASLSLLQDKAFLNIVNDASVGGGSSNNLEELYNLAKLPNPQRQAFSLGDTNFSQIATGNDTDGQFSLFDLSIPQQAGSQSYIYGQADEAFYILDGDVSFQQGDQTITATPGTFIYAPKGESYALSSLGTTSARALLISPGGVFNPRPIPEPSFIGGLLALAALGAVSLRKNKLQKQKLAHR